MTNMTSDCAAMNMGNVLVASSSMYITDTVVWWHTQEPFT